MVTNGGTPHRRRLAGPVTLSVLCAAVLGVFGLVELGPAIQTLLDQSETTVGRVSLRAADSVVDVSSVGHPLLARDRLTLVLFIDAHCAASRRDAKN